MERKSNISVWQLKLFEGLDKDVMVMQRDEEEVFDDAIHVFFEREYYDAYVSKATKYGSHRYAYHDDKLGEVIYQMFDEKIPGIVFHMNTNENGAKNILCDEKYLSAIDLIGMKDVTDSYHYMYTNTIERCSLEETVARLWTKYVYIIGQLPDLRKVSEGEKPVFELMTMKRKKDGTVATAEDFDYESLKVFLTPDSAMRFNPDKKPVSKYKLSLLSQIVKGKLQVVVEPHRSYWTEFDPAKLDIRPYLDIPQFNDDIVKEKVKKFFDMDKVYILLAPSQSDYRNCIGSPFFIRLDEKNITMYLFEKYEDAVDYVLQNPMLLPVFDNTFPIGVIDNTDKLTNLNTLIAIADKLGVTSVNLDIDTLNAIGCKMDFFKEVSERDFNLDILLSGLGEDLIAAVRREVDGEKQYRLPMLPFVSQHNDYAVSDDKKAEIISHFDDFDNGMAYLAGCSVAELMVFMREAAERFEKARKSEDEDNKLKYNKLMNLITIPLTEALCEKPYIFSLKEADGSFTMKNQLPYLIVTNRFEPGRNGEGRLMPVGIDSEQFMDKLYEASKVAVLADGPNISCLMDTKLMGTIAKQWKKSETLREELMIYLTQGCGLSYVDAGYYYRKLKSDSAIFVEFTSTVRNGEFPPMGMLTVEGVSAKELTEKYGFNILQAYDALLSLKADPKYLNKLKADGNEAVKSVEAEDKKGLFGKLFKK